MKKIFAFFARFARQITCAGFFALLQCPPAGGQVADSASVMAKADSLLKIARKVFMEGDFPECVNLSLDAANLLEQRFGSTNQRLSAAQVSAANGYIRLGKHPEAEQLLLRALAIREVTDGTVSPGTAKVLNSLGACQAESGQLKKAEKTRLRAVEIIEKTAGKDNRDYATYSANLAANYMNMGNYELAEPRMKEALAVFERTGGKNDPFYLSTLENLASLYGNLGKPNLAEPLLLEAKSGFAKNYGTRHPDYADVLSSLGAHCFLLGNFSLAEQHLREAISIRDEKLGPANLFTLETKVFLTAVFQSTDRAAEAEAVLKNVLELAEKSIGPTHPTYAKALANLANLYLHQGRHGEAENLLSEAVKIHEQNGVTCEICHLAAMRGLASARTEQRKHEGLDSLFEKLISLRKTTFGEQNRDFLLDLKAQHQYFRQTGNPEKAAKNLLAASRTEQQIELRNASFLSLQELQNDIGEWQVFSHFAGDLLRENPGEFPDLNAQLFDNQLFEKGFLLESAQRLNVVFDNAPAPARQTFQRWKGEQRQLANALSQPVGQRQNAAETESSVNVLEKELAVFSSQFGEARRVVDWQMVRENLRPGAAAIEFFRFRQKFPKPTDSVFYAALLLRSGQKHPVFIPLFEEKQLQSLLPATQKRRAEYANTLYRSQNPPEETPSENTPKTLHALLWKPIEKHFGGTKTICFSPAGLLHRLHLSAIPLPGDSTQTLGNQYNLVQLGSTRQLVVPSGATTFARNDALLFGGIFYDPDSTIAHGADTLRGTAAAPGLRAELDFAMTDSSLRGGGWKFLRSTLQEIADLRNTLKTNGYEAVVRSGQEASEVAFKQIGRTEASPRILHLATHGYFFPDPAANPKSEGPVFKMSDHPMIRSGLILAGANHAWKTGRPLRPGMEDGILTAYEISQMNLSATELVVLSACETGLGDIQGNEGVFGLQRAFKIAGAKHILMSLWQVPDRATQELMGVFYQKWLGEKMPLRAAFQSAQNEMKAKYREPFYWAGFVLVE